jgi:glycerophosphoryl diester phosphodiesterase
MSLLNIAHRGFSGRYPENTMMAFSKAIEEGRADGIETDVHLTSDGELVLIHDDTLERTTDGKGLVGAHLLAELRTLDAGLGERVPRLSELLELARDNNIIVNIELKNDVVPQPGLEMKVIDMVRDMGMAERVQLSSFNHESMILAKQIAPEFYTGLLYDRPMRRAWEYAKRANANALNPYYKFIYFQPGLARRCAKAGIELNVWTVNEADDIRKIFSKVSFGSVISNFPELLH